MTIYSSGKQTLPSLFTGLRLTACTLAAILISSLAPAYSSETKPLFIAKVENQAEHGSGFFLRLGKQVFFITAKHVIGTTGEPIQIRLQDDRLLTIPLREQLLLQKVDIAVIPINDTHYNVPTATLAKEGNVIVGDELTVWGYPVGKDSTSGVSLESRKGRYLGTPGSVEDGYKLLYRADTAIGFSGGPVLDRNGAVVAMHGRAESKVEPSGRRVRTGNALAIPIEALISEVTGNGIPSQDGSSLSQLQEQSSIVAFNRAVEILQRDGMSDRVIAELDRVTSEKIPLHCVSAARAYYFAFFSPVPDLANSMKAILTPPKTDVTPAVYYAFGSLIARKLGDFDTAISLTRRSEQRGGSEFQEYSDRRIQQEVIKMIIGCTKH